VIPRIKVVHLTIGLDWGGAENLMAGVVTRLDPLRFDVRVLALQKDGPVGQRLRDAGIPVTTLDTADRWDARAYFRLRQYLAREKPHIVHSHLLRANLLACLTRDDHTVVWHDHCTGEWLPFALRFLEKKLIPQSSAVIVVSKNVEEQLRSRVPAIASRIRIVPNAVETRLWKALAPADKIYLRRNAWGLGADHLIVGFVGRLDERFKGITFLLKSIARLKPSLPQLRLVMVGGGPDREMLEKFSRELGLEGTVIFMGPRSDIPKIIPGFDVLALPSISEGFGIVLLEAMAASLPVVASRVGGIPEVVVDQETGRLVPPGDPEALAEALKEILNDPEKRKRMGQKGLERVGMHYDLQSIVPKLEQIYFDIQNAK